MKRTHFAIGAPVLCTAALIVLVLGAFLSHAFAAEPPEVQAWRKLDIECRSAPLPDKGFDIPVCKRRQRVMHQLEAQGAVLGPQDVWIMRPQVEYYVRVIQHYDDMGRDNPLDMYDAMVPGILAELRLQLTDAQIFALWHLSQAQLVTFAPYAHVIMFTMMQHLDRHYASKHDPSLQLMRMK